jgi:hypothetical protein
MKLVGGKHQAMTGGLRLPKAGGHGMRPPATWRIARIRTPCNGVLGQDVIHGRGVTAMASAMQLYPFIVQCPHCLKGPGGRMLRIHPST